MLAGLPSGRGMVQINHICSACRDCTTTSLDDNYNLQLIPNVWRASKLKKVSKRPGHCLVITPTSWFPSLDRICIKYRDYGIVHTQLYWDIITCSIVHAAPTSLSAILVRESPYSRLVVVITLIWTQNMSKGHVHQGYEIVHRFLNTSILLLEIYLMDYGNTSWLYTSWSLFAIWDSGVTMCY